MEIKAFPPIFYLEMNLAFQTHLDLNWTFLQSWEDEDPDPALLGGAAAHVWGAPCCRRPWGPNIPMGSALTWGFLPQTQPVLPLRALPLPHGVLVTLCSSKVHSDPDLHPHLSRVCPHFPQAQSRIRGHARAP